MEFAFSLFTQAKSCFTKEEIETEKKMFETKKLNSTGFCIKPQFWQIL